MKLRIGTRKSPLAMWQARHLRGLLAAHQVELVGVTTSGDRLQQASLAALGGKGLFLKEIEQALAAGDVDLAIHSAKDVPVQLADGFVLGAFVSRADARDAWVASSGASITDLPPGSRVGTSSLRRIAQLRHLRPDLQLAPVRGNVDTRLAKLDAGDFDALVLACAGLDRLGLAARITERLSTEHLLPAVGQGALAIECRADDHAVLEILAGLDEHTVRTALHAERQVSYLLGADCTLPLAAHAQADNGQVALRARVGDPATGRLIEAEAVGADPANVAAEVARGLLDQGAGAIIEQARKPS